MNPLNIREIDGELIVEAATPQTHFIFQSGDYCCWQLAFSANVLFARTIFIVDDETIEPRDFPVPLEILHTPPGLLDLLHRPLSDFYGLRRVH